MTAAIVVVVMTVMFVFTAIIMVMMLIGVHVRSNRRGRGSRGVRDRNPTAVVFFTRCSLTVFFSRAHNIYSHLFRYMFQVPGRELNERDHPPSE